MYPFFHFSQLLRRTGCGIGREALYQQTIIQDLSEGGVMLAEVKVIEGGQLIKTEGMKLKLVKEFSDNIIIYENEEGRAVVYFKNKNEFVLISIDMA